MTTTQILRKFRDMEMQIETLRHQIDELKRPDTTLPEDILFMVNTIERIVGIPYGLSFSRSKKAEIVEAKMIRNTICYYDLRMSFPKIGVMFTVDTATARASVKKYKQYLSVDKIVRAKFIKVCAELRIDKEKVNEMIEI